MYYFYIPCSHFLSFCELFSFLFNYPTGDEEYIKFIYFPSFVIRNDFRCNLESVLNASNFELR